MNEFLSNKTIWLDPTPKIRALHGKTILIVEGDQKSPEHLHVAEDDPTGSNAGKCSVTATPVMTPNFTWSNVSSSQVPPTLLINHPRKRFLSQSAVGLIRRNDPPQRYGEFLLECPTTEESSGH
jgi:hypothetical protein